MSCRNRMPVATVTTVLLLVAACGNPSASVSDSPDDTSAETATAGEAGDAAVNARAAPAASADQPIVVTRFVGTPPGRFRAGMTLAPGTAITLGEGDRLWLSSADGSRLLTGPGRYVAGSDAPAAHTGALDTAGRYVEASTNDEGNSTTAAVRRTAGPPGSGGVRGPASDVATTTPRVTADMVRPDAPVELARPDAVPVRPRIDAVRPRAEGRKAADPSIVEQARGE